MGVHGLWDLLAPVGRRVSVETLSGKKLAIDASIWMVQFMKAMRDEKGEMVRNAHLLGFFRRICKLLYLRTKSVFVFDGGTPALKRRTVIARRRQRENAQAKMRKTAEKLLLNHLKTMRLKDLAEDLENQRKMQKIDAKGKKILIDQTHMEDNNIEEERNIATTYAESYNQEKLDEMLAASIAAEEDRHLNNNASMSAAEVSDGEEEKDSDENEEIILPDMDGNVDPAVLAALPTSMQLDLLMRKTPTVENIKNKEGKKDIGNQDDDHKGTAKAKDVLSDQMDILDRDNLVAKSSNQEKLDELLAASIAAEQDDSLTKIASTSAAQIPYEVEGDDEDEEMILPAFCGKVDPAVLAALPPSMQLDLLVQMRERLMAENRQRYQKVKKAPEKFSELQIEAYLKTVAFRREIDQVQKAAAGKDVGGVHTSRIASESNKEFFFSSSFAGDKQLLTSAGVQRNGNNSSDSVDHVASAGKSGTVTSFVRGESSGVFDEGVETYVDERGRIRVSRVRAMGMHMTRDLQRNLDLMKEIELERTHPIKTASAQPELSGDNSKKQSAGISHDNNAKSLKLNERNGQPILNNESSIQISFEVGGEGIESDDDIFTALVAGPVKMSSADSDTLRGQSSDSASDSDWQEGIVEEKDNGSSKDGTLETNPPFKESNINDDSEVEWEDGVYDVHDNYIFPSESRKPASRGYSEEEANLQEAIRRSLKDFGGEQLSHTSSVHQKSLSTSKNAHKDIRFLVQDANTGKLNLLEKDKTQHNKPFAEILAIGELDSVDRSDSSHVCSSSQRLLKLSEAHDTDKLSILKNIGGESDLGSNAGQSENTGENCVESLSADTANPLKAKEIDMTVKQSLDTYVEDVGLSTSSKIYSGDVSHDLEAVSRDMFFATSTNDDKMETEASLFVNEKKKSEIPCHSVELTKHMEPSEDSKMGTDVESVMAGGKNPVQFKEEENYVDKFVNSENLHADLSEADLQEEIMILSQERRRLGYEQTKLERNAESVSSEMFTECQELLQMFGLPYIIAPMEAEAQCAYMELANLVDGVVTDDSDVFLFGARSVYKNIFDDRKYVETYFMKDIEKELGLTREKLIHMALLLGSDYTEGISGIGIVNAIEVVNAFPEEDGLQKFREWIESPDPNILGKFDAQTGLSVRKKKGSEVGNSDSNYANSDMEGINPFDQNTSQAHDQEFSADHNQVIKQIFMNKHRNVSKNWHVPSSFPSEAVVSAYFCPQVDRSTDPFTWGKPDINVLRRLCWEKFGWGIQKSDELLLPVLKEYNKHETQLRLEAFYTFNERFAKIHSNRIKKAVKGITGNASSELMDDAVKESSRSRKKRTLRPGDSGDNYPETPSKKAKEDVHSFKTNSLEKSTRKQSRKRTAGGPVSSEVVDTGQSQLRHTQCRRNSNKGSHGDGRGKGRGKRTGRRKESHGFEQSDSSSVDISGGDDNLEIHAEKAQEPQELRRSTRTRKPAGYILNDSGIDDVGKSSDHDNEKSDKRAVEQPGSVGLQGVCKDAGTTLNSQEHQNAEDPLPEDFPKDYLETGGFVNEEDGSGEAALSKDYLSMGGGFCIDESGLATDQDAAPSPTITAAGETTDACYFSSLMEEADFGKDPHQSVLSVKEALNDIQDGGKTNALDSEVVLDCANATDPDDHSRVILFMPENTEGRTGQSSLSAMPSLKRKQRKS